MGGNKITGLEPGTDPTDAATVSQLAAGAGGAVSNIPIGAVIDYWGATPPEGYLFCAGQAVSRVTYAALFALMGTSAGPGDGSTTFNLPDYRGRVAAGRDNMNGDNAGRLSSIPSATLGASGGNQVHVLTLGEMPAHGHTVTDPGHTHTYNSATTGGSAPEGSGFPVPTLAGGLLTGLRQTGITIAGTGGGGAHPNVQPTIIANKIMRAL